jgi:CHASE2 domain-containing sensor protein
MGGRLFGEWVVLLGAATALVAALFVTGATTRLDNAIYDFALRFRQRPAPPEIVIVAIDFKSTAVQGEWPWPRAVQAAMLRKIAQDHPKAVALDVLYQAHGPIEGDRALREAISMAPVYLGMVLEEPGQGYAGMLTKPAAEFISVAAGVGRSNPIPDPDGIFRRALLYSNYQGERLPHLMMLVANAGRQDTHDEPLSGRDEILIPYAGPTPHFRQVSATHVLDGSLPPGLFKGKYVLVGGTSQAILDNYPTPMSGSGGMPNVEIDANILDAILHNHLIRKPSLSITLALSIGLLWLFFAGVLRLKPGHLVIQGAGAALFCLGGSAACLALGGFWLPPMPVTITGTLLQAVWSARRLQAASDYFANELNELQTRGNSEMLPMTSERDLPMGDSVSRQMFLIEETKQRMRALSQFVTELIAHLPDPVLVVSPQGVITMCNHSADQLGETLGRSTEPGAMIQPILQDLEANAEEGPPLWPPTVDQRAPRGVAPGGRILEARYTPTGYDGDQPRGWTVQLVDVTMLVSAMRQREDALKLFTHDMRAPQSAILAALEHREFQNVSPMLREGIEKNALRTISLADGFVRLAQAESAEYVFDSIDLFHPLGDAADALWPIAQAAKVDIVVRDPGREFVIAGDRGLLTRALINLIDNAVKFSPPGKAVICALSEATFLGRPAVALAVTDQAAGMSREQLELLFKRFARTKTTSSGGRGGQVRIDGVGLGLAVVHTVVTRHNGRIECESEIGKGATFTITLPLCEDAHIAEAQHALAEPQNLAHDHAA